MSTRSSETNVIDIGRAVTYPFDDKDWPLKIGILVVAGLIPGLNLIMWSGYSITVARRVMFNAPPLPDWADWMDIAVRGLLSLAATAIYFLPAMLVACVLLVISGSGALILRCVGGMFILGYTLLMNFFLNAGHLRFAQTDQFNVYLDVASRVRDLRAQPGLFSWLFLYQTGVSLIGIFVSGLLTITCIGVFAGLTFMFLANGFILGSLGIMFRRHAGESNALRPNSNQLSHLPR